MLIRHSAGVKDSALTIHGALQAARLGQHFAKASLRFTHIFSSDLRRAYKTAEAIRLARIELMVDSPDCALAVIQSPLLREQDFGFYEGKRFYARSQGTNKTGKDAHREQQRGNLDFKDVESNESMALRMDTFLDQQLLPILRDESQAFEDTIAIVSHGIILSVLWKCFLRRFAPRTVSLAAGLSVGGGGVTPLEHLGGWSNTGYLELDIGPRDVPVDGQSFMLASSKDVGSVEKAPENQHLGSMTSDIFIGHKIVIRTVNGKEHLKDLKRTGGGVGSSKFDESQKSIETFFKKRKLG